MVQFKPIALVSILALLMLPGLAQGAPMTECADKLDPKLRGMLVREFPKLRIPYLADLDQHSVDVDLKNNGDGCYVVANGDFEGRHLHDSALLLAPVKKGQPQLVVALQRDKSWKIFRLPTFCTELKNCYVKGQKPGTYSRSAALDDHLNRPDERMNLTSKNSSVLAGQLESTGVVYVYSAGRWLHVWVSD
jgi:hypothetical protein